MLSSPIASTSPLVYERSVTENVIEKPPVYDPVACSCVEYIKSRGIKVGGDAKFWKSFPGTVPIVGGVMILRYGEVYHAAYIEKITEEGLLISESNYKDCEYTTRLIKWNDEHIVQFWHD